jgi:hypothetical protein
MAVVAPEARLHWIVVTYQRCQVAGLARASCGLATLRGKEDRASMASLARRLLRCSERNTLAQKLRLWLESSGSHRELLLQVDRKGP